VLTENCYVHVIVAVGREGAGEAALALVERMKDHNVQPSTRYVQHALSFPTALQSSVQLLS
jgi:hypothetical protein